RRGAGDEERGKTEGLRGSHAEILPKNKTPGAWQDASDRSTRPSDSFDVDGEISAEISGPAAATAHAALFAPMDRLRRARALAEDVLLDLPRRGFRHRAQHDRARRLEVRQVRAAVGDELRLGGLRPGPELDERARRLAPLLVGLRHDRRRQ